MTSDRGFANGAEDSRRGIDFIGIACVFACHDGKGNFLLSKRSQNCRDEQGNWEFGSGSHELGKTVNDTVSREVWEEYGAKAEDIQLVDVRDVFRPLVDGTPTHWLRLLFMVTVDPREATNHEPYKIDEIGWFSLDNLPLPLHSQMPNQVEIIKQHSVTSHVVNGKL